MSRFREFFLLAVFVLLCSYLGAQTQDQKIDAEMKKLQGLWILNKEEANGGRWPISPDVAIYIEKDELLWVRKNGEVPVNCPRATISIDPSTKPMSMDLKITRGGDNGKTYLAIYKVEGDRLYIASNGNNREKRDDRPTKFSTKLIDGAGRGLFLRIYKKAVAK